jgi:hypothetical protein
MFTLISEDHGRGVVLQFRLRRSLTSNLNTLLLPTIILLLLIYSTNFIPSYYIDSVLICAISLPSFTGLLLLHSSFLPPTHHIKMSDIWLISCHCAALAQILLLLKMNCLNLEQEACQKMLAAIALAGVKDDEQKHRVVAVNHAKEASKNASSKVISFG